MFKCLETFTLAQWCWFQDTLSIILGLVRNSLLKWRSLGDARRFQCVWPSKEIFFLLSKEVAQLSSAQLRWAGVRPAGKQETFYLADIGTKHLTPIHCWVFQVLSGDLQRAAQIRFIVWFFLLKRIHLHVKLHDIMDRKDFQKDSLTSPNYSPDQNADQIQPSSTFLPALTFYTLLFSF